MKRTFATALALILTLAARAQNPVLTGQYNTSRTGANIQETILTPSNVASDGFGLLFTQPVDQSVLAQTLYVPGLTIHGAVHNVVFVATLNDSVFAFDADTSQPALWHTSLGTPMKLAQIGKIGILSTPVIDVGLNTIFVVALADEGGIPVYRLHALNLLTGADIMNVVVQGAVPGTGDDSQSTPCVSGNGGAAPAPCIPFKAGEQLQRPALLEDNTNTIYAAFATLSGDEKDNPYHGWMFGYQYTTGGFTQTLAFNSSPSATQTAPACSGSAPASNQCGHGAGIWMSGRGPALDATGIYVVTGNGGYGGADSGNWGESLLRLNSAGAVQDSFTPASYAALNTNDLDLGDAGAVLFTSANPKLPNLAVAAGKTGSVYVLNRAALGGLTVGNTGALQSFTATSAGCGTGPGQSHCYQVSCPALWNPAGVKPVFYVWAYGDVLRVWDFYAADNKFHADPNQGAVKAQNTWGAGLAVSSNGGSDGIVWGIGPASGSTAPGAPGPGALYAFDATNVSTPLWISTDYWYPSKFLIPTVANGKVYVPTSASPASASLGYLPVLRVYGLVN